MIVEENKIIANNNQNPKSEGKFSPYQVKLSCIFMGVGQLFCKQFTKGILLILLEIGFILFLAFSGVSNIIGIFTLGTNEGIPIMGIQGDNSVKMLAWGITTLFLCVLFGFAYYANIKDVIFTTQEIKKGHPVKNFVESCSALINEKFYFLTLTIPVIFVCIFNIMPIFFTGLVAFTNYGGEIVPPKLVDWIEFSNFSMIFTVSEYATTILKILGWNFIWAIGSTFINYFGGLGLAILYNSKCLKWKRFWRIFPMLAYAIPGFITLTGFRFLFSDSGPILALLRDWGWVSESFTFIGFDSKWSLRLLGFFSCAWISIPSIMFLATGILSNVNQDMYEAATLDGANGWKQFLYLTLPFVLFATTPVLLNSFISNFNNFSIFYFLRPEITYDTANYFNANNTDLLINWMFNLTVDKKLYSLGSALSLILFAFMAIFSLIVYVSSPAYKKEDTYK